MGDFIIRETIGKVAILTINRPDSLNAIGTLEDLLGYRSESHSASAQEAADMAHHKDAITAYRARYGVQD